MSQDELHAIAQADTPSQIQVPNTLQGLVVWAAARFGVGILVAAVFGYATSVVYKDMRSDREQLMDAYRGNTEAIQSFAAKIAEQSKAIEEAHRRAIAP